MRLSTVDQQTTPTRTDDRARASARRHPWARVVVAGAAVAVVVAVVPAALRRGDGGADPASTPLPTTGGWRTVSDSGVTFEVPDDWKRLDTGACRAAAVRHGPDGTDPCAADAPLAVASTRAVLLDGQPGLGTGYVLAGERLVTVAVDDPEVARRVLASVHVSGEDPGDLSRPWEVRTQDGVRWQQPGGGQVQVSLRSGATVDCTPRARFAAVETSDGGWRAGRCGDPIVTVVAPTQALADLVASTVRD